MKRIRVLVVDDSMVFREVLARGLATDPGIEVVATAVDPYDARDKILQYEPDAMILDVEMPKMNGIEFLRKLIPQYPLPTIVISTVSKAVFEAVHAGALDFVTKPDVRSVSNLETFIEELIRKVKIASQAKILNLRPSGTSPLHNGEDSQKCKIIAIGASTGGTEAIFTILKSLPSHIPGIVVTQHIPPIFSRMFAERLAGCTGFEVKEAQTGDIVRNGKVLVAPGDKHLRIKKCGDKFKVECFLGEKVSGHCPSVDVLFESVAKEAGDAAIGVLLTGMGYDGAKGLLAIRKNGGRTIGQDEKSSVVYGMPKVAFNIGAVEKQASLQGIPHMICSLL